MEYLVRMMYGVLSGRMWHADFAVIILSLCVLRCVCPYELRREYLGLRSGHHFMFGSTNFPLY